MDWHIALAQPNLEKTAFAHLQRLRYWVYYPLFPVPRTLYGKKTVVYQPMFRGYLFVQRGANQDWFRLETAPGIRVTHSLLSLEAGIYATITEDELTQIKETAKWLCEQVVESMKPYQFHVGDRVRITSGPFADKLADIEKLDDEQRIIMLRDYLSGMRIRAKPDHLTAA